jgi:uncharacterized protein YkwD
MRSQSHMGIARLALYAIASAVIAACSGGGGGDSSSTGTSSASAPAQQTAEITVLSPNASALENLSASGNFITDSFTYMNAFRQAAGLSTLVNNSQIATAAQNHATYEADNGLVTHDETLGNPGYTGATVDARIQAVHPTTLDGEITGSALVVQSQINQDSTIAITGLRDAPFHRENMFYCYANTGVGSANSTSAFNSYYNSNVFTEYLNVDFADPCSSRPADTQVVVWPFNGQTNVPNAWADTEAELPAGGALTNEHGTTLGYPITMQGYNNASFSNVNFTITDPNGNVIPCAEYDSSNNTNAQAAMAAQCVPLLELATSTVYTVKITGNMTNASFSSTPFTIVTSFTTQATNAQPDTVFYAPNLSSSPTQPVDGLNSTNTAILQAQYACQQYELSNTSASADCNWLANPLVAAGNTSGEQTATTSTTVTASN